MVAPPRHVDPPDARRWVWVACALGLIHAGFSLYWALGGRWLLATVGAWAVEAGEADPLRAGAFLGGVGLAKAAAAIIPVGVALGWLGGRRVWRAVSWIGACGLVLYGAVNVIVASLVLVSAISPDGGYDRESMLGHALLWDPLFALWGGALVGSLWRSRASRVRLSRAA